LGNDRLNVRKHNEKPKIASLRRAGMNKVEFSQKEGVVLLRKAQIHSLLCAPDRLHI
jgi:hypothetical protein